MKKTDSININGYDYSVTMIPGDRRSVMLRMTAPGKIEVRFPKYLSRNRIVEYIYQKRKWIEKKHLLLVSAGEDGAGEGIVEGRILYYSGEKYRVVIGGDSVGLINGTIRIPEEKSLESLDKWYRRATEKAVNEFIAKHRQDIPECIIKVKKQKNIWGSCNLKKRIYINSRLAMCPPDVVEYVIWHEICHLTHMNHSKEFYSLLMQKYPGYKTQKTWLKEHSMMLRI